MEQSYSSTQFPTVASSTAIGGASAWADVNNIKVDDAAYAWWGAFGGGQQSAISASVFGFPPIPPSAIIDGIMVTIEGSQFSAYGDIALNIAGAALKDKGTLNTTYGGPTDKWGLTTITPAHIANLAVTVSVGDVSGGDAYTQIEHLKVTVYWHIEPVNIPADVPTRVAYKVYSRAKKYLGELPSVKSILAFPQDINAAGSLLDITCAKDLRNVTTVEPLLTESGLDLLTEDDHIILAEDTDLLVTTGNSPDDAMFKNSNIIKAWLFDYWHPNGKLMFTGQVNRVSFSYGSSSDYVNLKVYSEGHDLANYIARGYPFTYVTDVSQAASNSTTVYSMSGDKGAGWSLGGQTFRTGAAVTNIGAITLRLQGSATVEIDLHDDAGNYLGTTSKVVNTGGVAANEVFEFASLIDVLPNSNYQFRVWIGSGQSITIHYQSTDVYANGTRLESIYGGGSGGGDFYATTGDLYFVTASGTPTTTTTYSSQDPITGTMDKILLDYNNRGGKIKKRTFVAAGITITYTFNMATILDAMKKMVDISPMGTYAYVDLGLSVMDIKKVGVTPDFKVVKGRDLNKLEIALTTEQVDNYLLFTGGETAGVNLYRDYTNAASVTNYGLRTVAQSDNRVTLAATADALGSAFIAENSEEQHETQITVPNKLMDITLLEPGKTIGFRNFGNFIDLLVLQIVRREYTPDAVTITLGRLPVVLSYEVQNIRRELLNEQTAKNPASPS